jgi:sulfate adenylyltransferase large subunit
MAILTYSSEFKAQDGVLRLITAGSVDDGKSTLIGRLLYDSRSIFDDQLLSVEKVAIKRGKSEIDLSLFSDGLEAEREQGITIDVSYQYFSTPRRKFIIADTPGHEQYTRNMVTGASTADAAIILIDAQKGVLTQTRRHAYIAYLLGVRHVIVAINKMDLVGYEKKIFDSIRQDFTEMFRDTNLGSVTFIPMSALKGDQAVEQGESIPWYNGETLLATLESIDIINNQQSLPLRYPVQLVSHTGDSHNYRGYAGRLASGTVSTGDEVLVLPSNRKTQVKNIFSLDKFLPTAHAGDSITVVLADDIDISRGDMICCPISPPQSIKNLEARICWMSEVPMSTSDRFLLKHTSKTVKAKIKTAIDRIDINSLIHQIEPETLDMNDIGRVAITLAQPIFVDNYKSNRETGSFILIDEMTHQTVAVGMIDLVD